MGLEVDFDDDEPIILSIVKGDNPNPPMAVKTEVDQAEKNET